MKVLKYGLVLLGVMLVCLVAFAPASLLDRAVRGVPDVDLISPQGTVWSGQAGLVVAGAQRGIVQWTLQPWTLALAHPTFDWQLSDPDVSLAGNAGSSLSEQTLQVQGDVSAAVLNQWLTRYLITIQGDFTIQPTSLRLQGQRQVNALDGQIDWEGGLVRYTLSGILHEARLPPLTAYLDQNTQSQPVATVYTRGGSTPLLMATVNADGFAKISMTKLFTKLLKNPWPGSDPDSAVVLEVEEKIF